MRKLKNAILGPRWLNVGGGGGGADKTEILVVIVLVLIIGTALALTFWNMFDGGSSTPAGPSELHFQCLDEECGHEWVIKVEDLRNDSRPELEDPMFMRRKCPKCGQMTGCLQMQCPNPDCKKWFVAESSRDPERAMQENIKDICPYCGTDIQQWWREHRKKR